MKVEQKTIYRCSRCNALFEDEAECTEHEKLCCKHIKVKTIWMHIDLVTGNPYFSVTTCEWAMKTYIDSKRSFDAVCSCGGSDRYEIYTTDLSKEAENKFKLELLNYKKAILEGRLKRTSESIDHIEKEIKKITRKTNAGKKGI